MDRVVDYFSSKINALFYPTISDDLIYLSLSIIFALISYFIIKFIILKYIEKVVLRTKTKVDNALYQKGVITNVLYFIPIFIVYGLIKDIDVIHSFIHKILYIVLIIQSLQITFKVSTSVESLLKDHSSGKYKNIKMLMQIFQMIVSIVSILMIFTVLLDSSILKILSGIGAMAAVLMLIFKDTILSFSASIHISMNKLLEVGDWIEMPSYGVDGDVTDISLNNVKVQNFDKTIVSIPKLKFLDNSFVNWKGMNQSGGRRIKRNLYIDQTTIDFCDESLIEKLKNIDVISSFITNRLAEIEGYNSQIPSDDKINNRSLTNIGVLRFYIEYYLRNHNAIQHKGFTLMVRQLEPTDKGLPIQIYCFTNTTVWTTYESIQADVFDHILAILDEFNLKVYQLPSGNDFKGRA